MAKPKPTPTPKRASLTHRGAILLTLSAIVSLVGGALTYMVSGSVPVATIALGTFFAAAWQFFDGIIDSE